MRRRSSIPIAVAQLFFQTAAVVTQRMSLMARGAMPAGEAVRMVAEKPVAFAKATVAAGAAATGAMVRRPLHPLAAFGAAAQTWTRTLTRTVSANRQRLSRRRKVPTQSR